jgi:hypothetical protein
MFVSVLVRDAPPPYSHLFAALWPNNEMQIEFRLRESALRIRLECIHWFCVVPYRYRNRVASQREWKKRDI